MSREVVLKIVLALVGLLFLALAYPLIVFVRQAPSISMMFSLYVTLGVFLLLADTQPTGEPQLDCFYRMVELRSCRRYGHASHEEYSVT